MCVCVFFLQIKEKKTNKQSKKQEKKYELDFYIFFVKKKMGCYLFFHPPKNQMTAK